MVYFCYLDESGTPEIPGNTSHYILAGLSIPINKWKLCDSNINTIKRKFNLKNAEIHTAWIARKYYEQSKIPDFETLDYHSRIFEVEKIRRAHILRLQKSKNHKRYKQVRKTFKNTEPYKHLSYSERLQLLTELADCIGKWNFARIFAECIDKIQFDPKWITVNTVDEQALEQVVSRFEQFLTIRSKSLNNRNIFGVLIHDNNETVSLKHTRLMHKFHTQGTLWTKINRIIETPLFVNSELTGLVQIADLCSYALRRYLENNDDELVKRIKSRFDKKNNKIVGVRHFVPAESECKCFICQQDC